VKIGNCRLFEKRVIGEVDNPLLIRWILVRFNRFGVYLHKLCRSDYDRALHDHPWPFVSIILRGGYIEVHDQTIDGRTAYESHKAGDILIRPAEWRHRFIIDENPAIPSTWTLVIVGKRQRRWGFFLPSGWCWWRKHNGALGICEDNVLWTEGSD
jgi:hypothetical protein